MLKLRKLSGQELIKALTKLGYKPKRQKGSHVILTKETESGKTGCTVPLHGELKIGTIKGILKQAKISEQDLIKLLK
ncbi:MAG: type II toxin-antitoxin system HicA family toxin [Candidatus Altiarchaeota archaeon]|nr:type II toxin-antitoxin system HicA family toxin [Candidatus Altiarchaeota archaeon]